MPVVRRSEHLLVARGTSVGRRERLCAGTQQEEMPSRSWDLDCRGVLCPAAFGRG